MKTHFEIFPLSLPVGFGGNTAPAHKFVAVAENTVAYAQRSNTADTFDFGTEDQILSGEGTGIVAEDVKVLPGNSMLFTFDLSAVHCQRGGFGDKDILRSLDSFEPFHVGLEIHGDFFCCKCCSHSKEQKKQ